MYTLRLAASAPSCAAGRCASGAVAAAPPPSGTGVGAPEFETAGRGADTPPASPACCAASSAETACVAARSCCARLAAAPTSPPRAARSMRSRRLCMRETAAARACWLPSPLPRPPKSLSPPDKRETVGIEGRKWPEIRGYAALGRLREKSDGCNGTTRGVCVHPSGLGNSRDDWTSQRLNSP